MLSNQSRAEVLREEATIAFRDLRYTAVERLAAGLRLVERADELEATK